MTKEEAKRRLNKCGKETLSKVLVLVLDNQLDPAGVERIVEIAEELNRSGLDEETNE